MPPISVALSADFLDPSSQLVFPDIGLDTLSPHPRIQTHFLPTYHPEYTPGQLTGIDALLSLKPRVTAESLAGVTQLCAIGRFGVGYDNVDLAACTAADVAVYITRQAVVRPVASSIVLLVLASAHHLVRKDRLLRQGLWAESTRLLGREPRDRVLGTVGLGNIAREALRLLQPFDFAEFLAYDPALTHADGVRLVPLETLFAESDFVLINCPLTPQTRGLINEPLLRRMKPNAVFINTARGPIVDEAALTRVLADGAIRCAALDVFAAEPLPPTSPLTTLDNTILTSHSLCWTEELFRDMGRESCAGLLALAAGQPPAHVVNPEVLSRPGFLAKLARLQSLT